MNHSYVDPHLRCIGQSFVVLAQPTAPAEPRECSFNHPSSRQHLKVVAVSRALHNLEHPACHGPDPLDQLSSIASIGPDQPHSGESPSQFIDDQLGSISILNIGRMHHHRKQQPHGIYNDVSLSTVDLLASVIATRPPFSVVFTDWLSMMAALGVGLPPSAVDGQRKCPAKWPAKMSLVLLGMITDGFYPTRPRFMGGLTASMYFLAVSRWMPSSRATPRIDSPLRFAF